MKRLILVHSLKVYQHHLGTAGEKSRAPYRQGVITPFNDILGNEYMSITGQNRAKNASKISRSYRQGKGMEHSRNSTQLNVQGQLSFKF